MVTSQDCINRFGTPINEQSSWESRNMALFQLNPTIHLANGVIPSKIYCNKIFGKIIEAWLLALLEADVLKEIKTWDGCFNVRMKRGLRSLSLHAFGCAVDINASHNPLGLTAEDCRRRGLTPFSEKFIATSRPFVECGADWKTRPDGMHFQIKSL